MSSHNFGEYDKDANQEDQNIRAKALQIDKTTIIEFFEQYRGKDLLGKIATKLSISRRTFISMVIKEQHIAIITHYLKDFITEVKNTTNLNNK